MQRKHSDIYTSKTGEKVVKREKKTRSCLKKRRSRRWVWEHFDELSDTTLRCKLCKESIKYASNMFRHMQRNHADIHSTKVDKKIVKKEKKTPTSRKKRGRPRHSWVWRYYACNVSHAACKLCKKVFQLQKDSSTGNLIKHLMKFHKEVTNKGKRNRSRRWLWEHFDKINDTTLQCKLCKLPVKHSTNMLQHIRRKHSDLYKIKVEENVVIEKIKDKPLPRKRGRPHRSWVWAYFVRTSKNRATCKICDKAICSSFSTTGNLIIHLKKVHKKDAGWIWLVFEEEDESDKYSCRICSFKCTKTEDLKNDIQTICDHLKTEHGLESGDQVSTVPDDKNKVVVKHIKDGSDQDITDAVQDVISMYFTKESSDQLKCNICSTVLTTDDNNTAPKDHIRDSHRGVYELHKDILECSMGYQIEFLQFSVSDSKTQPVIIEEICETQPEVTQDQLPKGVENRQYIFLSSVKSDDTCRKRSWVWKYFDKLSQTIFRCNLCNVVLSIKGCNSNNMNRHIRSRHPVIYGSELEMKIKSDEKRTGILSKGKPLRSWVWTYFNRDSRTRATCKLCDKTINHGGNATGNLNRHLKIIHEKNDDPHYWIWKVFDNDSEDYYSCKLCTFKLAKTDNFDICVQIILDHLKDQHGLVSAEQIFTVKDYEEDEG